MNNLFTSGIYALGLGWVMFHCFNSYIGFLLINFNAFITTALVFFLLISTVVFRNNSNSFPPSVFGFYL